MGHRTEPCGNPDVTGTESNSSPSACGYLARPGSGAGWNSIFRWCAISGFTLSKDLEKSSNIRSTMVQMAHFSFPYYFTIPNSEFRIPKFALRISEF